MPSYKSYCRSLGTTSFRRKELNKEIESQLKLLIEFWEKPENVGKFWVGNRNTQKEYYDFMLEKGFVSGHAPNKDKDAREKTSGLVDLGLADDNRRITEAGIKLLNIIDNNDFISDNILGLSKDSYIYLKQLIKMSFNMDEGCVRPFIVITDALCHFQSLNYKEFWLLPLIISPERKDYIFNNIEKLRQNTTTLDEIIWTLLSSMDNYREAERIFLDNEISENIMSEIGMNRDGFQHDKPYFYLYNEITKVRQQQSIENILSLFNAVNNISLGCKPYWKKLLFCESRLSIRKIKQQASNCLNLSASIFQLNDNGFKKEFFKQLHLIKAKNLLDNYADLNKRILKTSNSILFVDDTVKLDIIPHCFFSLIANNLKEIMFEKAENLHCDISIKEINRIFDISQEDLVEKARELYGAQIENLAGVQLYVENQRYERLNQMIDEKFTDETLVNLMTYFENRSDNEIQAIVTNNADVPTIFEYVLAIAWYKISGRQGKVLEYMNLSLDADLLPITHAAGGHEDITYKYEATENYPAHTLLIEATLANSTNQRRMEMEPVSRHLGDYLLNHTEEAYCVFATTFLHVNVVADFRGRKFMPYYSSDGTRSVNGMRIIPCNTEEIKTIIQHGITYAQLYRIFEEAHKANTAPNLWYDQEIKNKL